MISQRGGEANNYTSMPGNLGNELALPQKKANLSLLNTGLASTKASEFSNRFTKRGNSPAKIDSIINSVRSQYNSITYAKGRSLGKHQFFPEKIAL